MKHQSGISHHNHMYKVLARAVGLLVCGFFLFFLVAAGLPDLLTGKGNELIPFLPFLLLPIVGYLVSWFREQAGTRMILAGSIGLFAWLMAHNGLKAALIYSVPFMITGLLFVLHLYKRKSLKK